MSSISITTEDSSLLLEQLGYRGNCEDSRCTFFISVERLPAVFGSWLWLRLVSNTPGLGPAEGVAVSNQSSLCRWAGVWGRRECGDVDSGVMSVFGPWMRTVLSSDAFSENSAGCVPDPKRPGRISTMFGDDPLSMWAN